VLHLDLFSIAFLSLFHRPFFMNFISQMKKTTQVIARC